MTQNNPPDFIDNRFGNTLEEALRSVFSSSVVHLPQSVRLATAYFNPDGFAKISDYLTSANDVRLLLGTDFTGRAFSESRRLGESQSAFEKRRLKSGLNSMQKSLCNERDRLPFNRASHIALRKLITALNGGNLVVRRYEKAFLHAKAYIFSDGDNAHSGIIAGSSNLTAAGLGSNLELNIGRYDAPITDKAVSWFDELWEDAVDFDLADMFEEAFRLRTPWEIFIRVLWQFYGDEVQEDEEHAQKLPLTSFQKHGVARAMRLIREIGGAIVADEVGLGKTFIAGEILDIYRQNRQRALLICPAALRDTTWKKFLGSFEIFAECLSFEQLARDNQLRTSPNDKPGKDIILRNLDEYHLVIVDEAHNCRNPDAPTRAGALRKLLYGQRRDVLLLTATPVNNSLWDLFHLIHFFVRQDAALANKGVLSIRERFHTAMAIDPSSLSPDVLYPIIDATTVKRTRQFVKKHYGNDYIETPNGRMPIVFPAPKALSVHYNLDELLPGFFDHLEDCLNPDSGQKIQFARYNPDKFLKAKTTDEVHEARIFSIDGLLRSSMLKRFESSAYAFTETTKRMIAGHEAFLSALECGFVVDTQFLDELSAEGNSDFEDLLKRTTRKRPASLYNKSSLEEAVVSDLNKLKMIRDETDSVSPQHDPKLIAFTEALRTIVREAEKQSVDTYDAQQKRKVLVFSYFKDTVDWIYRFIKDTVEQDDVLRVYRKRITTVSGSESEEEGEARISAVQGFAPLSMESPNGKDKYDMLISTDVLAEGVNLQQCRHIINYDMPWNPMRLVQRHGRIDRIGSAHKRVYLRTVFPADRLDRLLNLQQRIINKLAMAARSIGVVGPIEGATDGRQVFTETRAEIEKLLLEDASIYERGATESAAQSGEEYRQTLRTALTENRTAITELPWKIGSGMKRGRHRGVFFCAVVGDRTFVRFVSADDSWAPEKDRTLLVREVGTCLRMIECEADTAAWLPDSIDDRVYDFWDIARTDIYEEWITKTDPANIQPRIRPLNHRVAEFMRNYTPVGADQQRWTRAIDILESPWPMRDERMLREWFENDAASTKFQRAEMLAKKILGSGLEPLISPEPLPPIEHDDIQLLCWLALTPATESVQTNLQNDN